MAAYAIPGGEGLVLNKKNLDSKLNFWGGGYFVLLFTTRINCHIKLTVKGEAPLKL